MNARAGAATVAAVIAAVLASAASGASGAAGASGVPISVAAATELRSVLPLIDSVPEYSFADSQLLANTVRYGAHEDVFAGTAADARALARARTVGSPVEFATTRMVLIVPRGNPGGVGSAPALARTGVSLVLGQAGSSLGDDARAMLARLGLGAAAARARGAAKSPQALVNAVATGQADASLVYAADLGASARRVHVIPLPAAADPVVALDAAVVTSSSQPAAAAAFVAELCSPAGQSALRAAGFGTP